MRVETLARTAVARNNVAIRRRSGSAARIPLEGRPWAEALRATLPAVRDEWLAWTDRGGVLPRVEDVFGSDQGNDGVWRAGILLAQGRRVQPLADLFPVTTAALLGVPGMRGAMWSVLEPGCSLPPHEGANAGGLRLLVGVDGSAEAAVVLQGERIPMESGQVLLFDDTFTHSSANDSDVPRVVILCDVLRPLAGLAGLRNRLVHWALHEAVPAYRRSPARAAAWHRALNGDRLAAPGPAPTVTEVLGPPAG